MILADELCYTPKPSLVQACNRFDCPPSWYPTEWQEVRMDVSSHFMTVTSSHYMLISASFYFSPPIGFIKHSDETLNKIEIMPFCTLKQVYRGFQR